jgi:hypothetical protein
LIAATIEIRMRKTLALTGYLGHFCLKHRANPSLHTSGHFSKPQFPSLHRADGIFWDLAFGFCVVWVFFFGFPVGFWGVFDALLRCFHRFVMRNTHLSCR